MSDPNSALHWLNRILADLNDIIPATVVVPYPHNELVAHLEGEPYERWQQLAAEVWEACQKVGVPAFVRTDLASAKHNGPVSYKVQDRAQVEAIIGDTVEDNELKFWPFGPTPAAFLVRQFLDLDAPFEAFQGHPIAREWRYFANADEILCRHFYWPEHAILGADRPHADWQPLLEALAAVEPPDELGVWAQHAAALCGPAEPTWSVDFAQDRTGRWWLIDMATADSSWHPEHG